MTAPPVVLPKSSLNKMAKTLGSAPAELQPLARNLIEHGCGEQAELDGNAGKVRLRIGDYSTPIYQYDESFTKTREDRQRTGWFLARSYQAGWSINAGTDGNVAPGAKVPVKTGMVAGTGNDQICFVEDRRLQKCWEYWIFQQAEISGLHGDNIAAGYLDTSTPRIVNGATSVYLPFSLTSNPIGDRGFGLIRRALITTAEEIATGRVMHPGILSIPATWWCDELPGTQGVDWLLPARRCEFEQGQSGRPEGYAPERRQFNSLEGLRIAAPTITPAMRENFVNERVTNAQQRWFWKVICGQWAVYGLVVGETGGYGMGVATDGMLGPARSQYEDWGFEQSLLAGHIQEDLMEDYLNTFIDHWIVVRPAA